MIENFIDISYLATLTGCVAVVMLLTQFTKELIDKYFKKIPTKYIVFVYALVTIVVYQITTSTFDIKNLYITLINAIIIALTSIGAYNTK